MNYYEGIVFLLPYRHFRWVGTALIRPYYIEGCILCGDLKCPVPCRSPRNWSHSHAVDGLEFS